VDSLILANEQIDSEPETYGVDSSLIVSSLCKGVEKGITSVSQFEKQLDQFLTNSHCF